MIAIDLGSNSIRIGKFDFIDKKLIERAYYSEVTTISDKIRENGYINEEAINRTINAIKNAKKEIDFDRNYIAYTTEAVRKASNKDDVIKRIADESGITFEIIDGDKEAELVENILSFKTKEMNMSSDFVMLDLGGGSSEIAFRKEIVVDDKLFIKSKRKSFKIGIVTLTQAKDNIEFLEDIMNEVDEFIKEAMNEGFSNDMFLSTSGGPNTVAAVKNSMTLDDYANSDIKFTKIDIDDIKNCEKLFNTISDDEIGRIVGSKRTKFMITGLKLLQAFFGKISSESIVLKEGLLEGIALEFYKKGQS